MAGVAGTTLCDELNRLANGGATYPTRDKYFDEQGAANVWAASTGLALVGALNKKAGNTSALTFLDLRGACNKIAGTTDLDPVTALRTLAS